MEFPDIYSATLGLSDPWKITDVTFAPSENRMDINIAFPEDVEICCPLCGTSHQICHAVTEVWYHENFFNHITYLHTKVPFIRCCKQLPVERPWSRVGSKFTLVV